MRAPAVFLALPLLAGACAGVLLVDDAPMSLSVAAAAAAVVSVVAGCGFLAEDTPGGVILAVVLGGLCAGYASGASATRALYAPSLLAWYDLRGDDDPVVLEGELREDGASVGGGVLLTINCRRVCTLDGRCEPLDGGVRVSVSGDPATSVRSTWRAGRPVRVAATLRRPASFGNPGTPDAAQALARRGVALTGTVKSAALVEVVSRASLMEERAADVRAWARGVLAVHVGGHDPRSAAVATAILIGDRTGLPDEDERRLQDAGTYHVIAISGGNIAILAALLLVAARVLRIPYRAAAIGCALVLLFYGEVAGGVASVERAIAAAVLFLSALALDHRGASLNVLSIAALLAVGLMPVAVLDAGFLLSFGATAGIILGVPAIVRFGQRRGGSAARRGLRVASMAVAGIFAATVCAEIALLPVTASLFSRVTVAGLLLNFAAIPLMTAVQCGSLALLALSLLHPPAAAAAGALVHHAAYALVESARFVDLAPWTARDVPAPAIWLCVVYYSAAAAALRPSRVRRAALVVLACAWAAVFAGPAGTARGLVAPPAAGVLRVVILDVGQGDASVAILPDGRALLVDAGGLPGTTFDIGGRVLLPALRALQVRSLHALVVTHPDPDHIGGAETVIRRLGPSQIWEGVPVPPHAERLRLVGLAETRRMVWRTVRPGQVERAGGVDVRIHHPPAPDWERQRVRNDDSVVLELRRGDVSILLPGDIGREVEAQLVDRLDLAPVVVLKAAHHGSATSSGDAFIDATAPAAVIFSAGRHNPFGHPAKVVVDRFARRGIPMFNTADDGAVFVETDGVDVEVRGWRTGRVLSIQQSSREK